jgi:hypothetical protein
VESGRRALLDPRAPPLPADHGNFVHQQNDDGRQRNPGGQRLPDLEFSETAVLNSLTSVDGQRGYGHAIDEFVDWHCSEPRLALNRAVVPPLSQLP